MTDWWARQLAADLAWLVRRDRAIIPVDWLAIIDVGCRLPQGDAAVTLRRDLETAATPDDTRFASALAILLADCIRGGKPPDAMALTWEAFSAAIIALPPVPRAPILRAFEYLEDRSNLMATQVPEHQVSTDGATIRLALEDVARSLTEEEIDAIAACDYHKDTTRHRAALLAVLDDIPGGDAARQSGFRRK